MRQIVLTAHRAEHIEAQSHRNSISLVQRCGPKYKVIILSWGEAVNLAQFIQEEARKEMESCKSLKSDLQGFLMRRS
jgi:hypothetical protein